MFTHSPCPLKIKDLLMDPAGRGNFQGKLPSVRNLLFTVFKSRWGHLRVVKMDPASIFEAQLKDGFKVLKDIEADRAAYFYLRDLMEWASEPSSKLMKVQRWKEESEEMLEELFRSKWGDELYAFVGG